MPAWLKGSLVLTVTVAAGVVIGMAYERHRTPAHGVSRMAAHHVMQRFGHDLDLDSAQHKSIGDILARRQLAVDSTWHVVQPHMRATLDSTLREIAGVLRPGQVERFRKMVEAMHPGVLMPPR